MLLPLNGARREVTQTVAVFNCCLDKRMTAQR